MPLVNCPECSRQISDAARACPHCAYPLRPEPTQSAERSPKVRGRRPGLTALSGVPLLGVLALFVLPLITISANFRSGNEAAEIRVFELASITGYDMVVGGQAESTGEPDSRAALDTLGAQGGSVDIEVFAVIAAAAAALGAVAAFGGLDRRVVTVIAAVGAAALIGLMIQYQADFDELKNASEGTLTAKFALAFWLSLAAFGLAALLPWLGLGRQPSMAE